MIELRARKTGRGKEVYCSDVCLLDELIDKKEKKVLLRDLIQNEIRSVLYARPNEPLQKGELYRLVAPAVPCLKATFYQYLDKMDGIEQYSENGKYYAAYKLSEPEQVIQVDASQFGGNEAIFAQLSRPLSKLTVSDVDMALFELGLMFENSLRSYLEELRVVHPGSVSSKDLSRLSSMIDCAVRIGVVKKGHHLTTLREERNNRAHGTVLDEKQRKVLFNKAHYLAELFVKYICFFSNQEANLTTA